MSETSNIAEIARKVAKDIFGVFGWQVVGPKDHDFGCSLPEKHNLQTHPSDVVFWYDDPYEDAKVFLNTDLKSWKAETFSKAKIRGDLVSLCRATECANISPSWASLYGDSGSRYQVHGLLFLFNRDAKYQGDVSRMLSDFEVETFQLPQSSRVFVLTPRIIAYLSAVSHDIINACGRGVLPRVGEVRFYYPDLVDVHPRSHERKVATAEVLCSPWQVLRYTLASSTDTAAPAFAYYIYYRGSGDSEDEFKYLIDYLFRYQLLDDYAQISLRMPFAGDRAAAVLERAKASYADDFYGLTEFRQRLDRITFERIPLISIVLSPTDEGMENG